MTRRYNLLRAAIIAAYLVLATSYSVVVPLWEAPDEVAHFDYVAELLRYRALPQMRVGHLDEAHQPPLYYLAAALAAAPADLRDESGAFRLNPQFEWAGGGGKEPSASLHDAREAFPYRGHALALHLARAVSIVCGAVTVWLTLRIGHHVAPRAPAVALLAGSLVAFNPQFLFVHGALNNDSLVTALSTAGWLQLLRTVQTPRVARGWLLTGVWTGLALLTKVSAAPLAGVASVALGWAALSRRSILLLVRGGIALGGAATAIFGWWLVRNVVLYGDPTGWRMYRQVFGANLRSDRPTFQEIQLFWVVQFRSFWATFGWMNVQAPEWFHGATRAVCLAAVAGVALLFISACVARWGPVQARGIAHLVPSNASLGALALLALAVLAQEAYTLSVLQRCNASCYQGRYMFPVVAPVGVLIASGLIAWAPGRVQAAVAFGVSAVCAGTALYLLASVIAPAYQ